MAAESIWALLEAARILAMWEAGAGEAEGITPELIDWCLQQTGDA